MTQHRRRSAYHAFPFTCVQKQTSTTGCRRLRLAVNVTTKLKEWQTRPVIMIVFELLTMISRSGGPHMRKVKALAISLLFAATLTAMAKGRRRPSCCKMAHCCYMNKSCCKKADHACCNGKHGKAACCCKR